MTYTAISAKDVGVRPPCQCHGEPQRWFMRGDLRAGGYWYCRVKIAESVRRAKAQHPERYRRRLKDWQQRNIEYRRIYQRRWRYGLTDEEWHTLFERQDGVCVLCGQTNGRGRAGLMVDHDHNTGKVRGLLCHRCNTSLERAEQVGWLERAAAYLRGTR